MKRFKNILKYFGIAILLMLLISAIYVYIFTPKLPNGTDKLIAEVRRSPLPELVHGKTGLAKSQGLNIWYERIDSKGPSKGNVLLIMGISNDALAWPEKFIADLSASGYTVVRYDHRGTGNSDWVKNWDRKKPYSLADMADDGIAVMNALNIQKANIVGVSMGGMIAQELVIHHPERASSLTSIMSSGFIQDPLLPKISGSIAWALVRVSLKYGIFGGEQNMIKLHLASRIILRNKATYQLNEKEIAQHVLYDIRKRNGYNSNASQQHQAAVSLSGSRYEKLKLLKLPTLIIHGKSDPFIPIAHGKKCASIIPGADSLWVENMGHDLPDQLSGMITSKMISNFKRKM